jgi:hypothetical protein
VLLLLLLLQQRGVWPLLLRPVAAAVDVALLCVGFAGSIVCIVLCVINVQIADVFACGEALQPHCTVMFGCFCVGFCPRSRQTCAGSTIDGPPMATCFCSAFFEGQLQQFRAFASYQVSGVACNALTGL